MSMEAAPWSSPGAVPAIRDALRSLLGGDLDSVWQAPDREVAAGLAAIGQARLLLEAAEVALVREGLVRGLPGESAWGPHDWVRVAEGSHAPTPATRHVSAVVRTAGAGVDPSGPTPTGAPDPDAPVPDLAGVTEALADGDLPLGKADQLVRFHERVVRVADPEELGEALATLVEGARDDVIETGPDGRRRERVRGLTERELAAAIRMTERLLRPEKLQEEDDEQGKRGRSLTKGPGPCGLGQYKLILEPEGAAVVDSAVAALSGPVKGPDGEPDPRPAARRRADALIEIIRRGVSSPGETPTCDKAQVVVTIGLEALLGDEQARGDAFAGDTADPRASGRGRGHTGPTRAQPASGGLADGMARGVTGGLVSASGLTMTGEVLPPSVVRRMACDGGIVPALLGSQSEILDLGRSVRWFTPGQKKALWLRDRGCTFPGCTMPPQWTDAHHVDWWSRGGGTDVSNGALLCERHHTHVHTHGLTAMIDATGVTWHREPPSAEHTELGRQEQAWAGMRFASEGRAGSLGSMHVTRIGLAPVKGTRHTDLPAVDLDPSGPVGDRVFCLVDILSGRVIRTVDHPRLTLVDAAWDGTTLTVRTPDGREVVAAPEPTGRLLELDYWGRGARVELLGSPHAQLLGDHLAREVHLARVKPGEVVYGSSVSLVTTGEIATLGETDSRRFRATFTIDADRSPTPGTEVTLGGATIRVRAPMPRCRVIDINTATGEMDSRHLATLADWPRQTGELWFGVDADVLTPGTVHAGDPVTTDEPLRQS